MTSYLLLKSMVTIPILMACANSTFATVTSLQCHAYIFPYFTFAGKNGRVLHYKLNYK